MANTFNSNDYQRGFKDGKAAAIAGKDKNFTRSGMSSKFVIHGSVAIDSYNKGYHAGYEGAMQAKLSSQVSQTNPIWSEVIRNKNNNNNLTNSTNMARQTSFSYQIELAEDLKNFLHQFQDSLSEIADNYVNRSNQLHEAGMMEEIFNTFESNYIEVTVAKIQDLINQINECDIPFVRKYIKYLEESSSVK